MGLQVPSDDGYPDIPFPSEKGALMVDLFRSAGWKGEELCSLNRVRLHLQMPFVSDVVLANGCKVSSSYDFPREEPTLEGLDKVGRFLDKLHAVQLPPS